MSEPANITSMPTFGLKETVSYCYILPTICLLGIFGNTANLITLASKRLGATSYMYLRALAVADLLCMIWVLIFVFLEIAKRNPSLAHIPHNYIALRYIAHLMLPLINWAISSATLVVVSLTFDRYVSVCWPLYFRQWNSPKRAWMAFILAYSFSFLLYVPMCFELDVFYDNQSLKYTVGDTAMKKSIGGQTYRWTREAIVKFIPILTVAVLNVLIVISLKRHRELRARMSRRHTTGGSGDGNSAQKDNQSLLYLLTGISVLFFICKVPAAMNLIIINEALKKQSDYQLFRAIANLLEITNQAVNFYVFCLCSSDYRSTFLEKFPCVQKMHTKSTDFKRYVTYRLMTKKPLPPEIVDDEEEEADGTVIPDGLIRATTLNIANNEKINSSSTTSTSQRSKKSPSPLEQIVEDDTIPAMQEYKKGEVFLMDEEAFQKILASPAEVYL